MNKKGKHYNLKEDVEKNIENNNKKTETSKYKIIICRTIALLMIICTIVIFVRAVVYKQYDIFGYRIYMIMSGSMEDTISIGDAVISKSTQDLKEGDIIAFELKNVTTVHRITKVYTEGNQKLYKTKGDNNNAEDAGIIKQEDIHGKVIFKLPKVGKILLYIKKNIVFIIIFIMASIAIVYTFKMLFQKNT